MSPGRRRVLAALALALSAGLRPSSGAGTLKRIVVQRDNEFNEKRRKRIAKLFADHGFVEGRDISIEFLDLGFGEMPPPDREKAVKRAIASRPDLILAWGDDALLFKRFTSEIPIVFQTMSFDPVRMGLVASLQRPGGNVTGTLDGGLGVIEKCWELAKDLRPGLKRFGTLVDDGLPMDELQGIREHQERAAKRLGVKRVEIFLSASAPFSQIERAIAAAKVEALDVSTSVEDPPWVEQLMAALIRTRILGVWATLQHVFRGGLLSVSGNGFETREVAVQMAAKILRGANPAQIPVYDVKTFVTSINLRTAHAMGLEVPRAVLMRANFVMEKDGTWKPVQW